MGYPALIPGRAVQRPRLVRLLDSAVEDDARGVALVIAPAGSGKTTVLADWIQHRFGKAEDSRVAFLAVDDASNQDGILCQNLLRALAPYEEERSRHVGEAAPHAPNRNRAALVNALRSIEEVCLVLDDAHLLHDAKALSDLGVVLDAAQGRHHVVVSGRYEPPLAFQQLRLEGRILDVTATDLAFTAEEASLILAEHGVCLDADSLAALMERTEGWAAGIRLAGMSLEGHEEPARLIGNFTGCQRAVADYLIEQILTGLPDEIRQFLLKTSVPTTFTVSLAEELTGCIDARVIIEQLERRNFLISRVECETPSFRYHPLLRGYLRAEISRLGRDAVADLEHVAALWYTEFGDALLSLEHNILAGDVAGVAETLTSSGLALIHDGHGDAVEQALASAPRTIRDLPVARLIRAAGYLHAGRALRAAPVLRLLDGEQESLSGDLRYVHAALHLQCALAGTELREALTADGGLCDGLPSDPYVDAFLSLQQGQLALIRGNTSPAHQRLRRARTLLNEVDNPPLQTQATTALAEAALCMGALTEALTLSDGQRGVTKVAREDSLVAARKRNVAAICHYLRAEAFQETRKDLHAPDRDAVTPDHDALPDVPSLVWALMELEKDGSRHRAVSALHRAYLADPPMPQAPGLTAALLPSIMFTFLRIGETVWARELLDKASADLYGTADVAILESIQMLSMNDCDRARTILRPTLGHAAFWAAPTNRISAWLVEAELARRHGHTTRVHEALNQALRVAEPEGVLRPFHDLPACTKLLSISRGQHGTVREFAHRVAAAIPRTGQLTITEPLTRRERELLTELPTWRTTEEIAADLCVSINTVKSHLRGVYRKLGVNTRRDAVIAAQDLGLI